MATTERGRRALQVKDGPWEMKHARGLGTRAGRQNPTYRSFQHNAWFLGRVSVLGTSISSFSHLIYENYPRCPLFLFLPSIHHFATPLSPSSSFLDKPPIKVRAELLPIMRCARNVLWVIGCHLGFPIFVMHHFDLLIRDGSYG